MRKKVLAMKLARRIEKTARRMEKLMHNLERDEAMLKALGETQLLNKTEESGAQLPSQTAVVSEAFQANPSDSSESRGEIHDEHDGKCQCKANQECEVLEVGEGVLPQPQQGVDGGADRVSSQPAAGRQADCVCREG